MGGRDENIIAYLWKIATSENSLMSFWGWVAIFLLGCSYFGGFSFWNGLQGKDCGADFGSGSDIPFRAAGRAGCFVRSIGEIIFPENAAPTPTRSGSVVRPPKAP
ncbi:hypothetical protein [Kamptonema sp. UHCC 0994]|uniref:hypothetical protein n=1 Tax=Kamptonema sp. UHCC 0994 TaxID=3031329 RepID=UPI0023B97F8D|nr:hypothetical protein [Kamptonema sp. UHCC 0994]MDF0552193.1 hypothetical protein [Kamptonema sp. UHCC 0994]